MPATSNPPTPTHDSPARGLWPVLGWACFLGCSWTWVIGMVWPAMLLADYGPWSWLAFALPNVLGAAAMGWVIYRPERSVRIVEQHETMAKRFSQTTLGFHLFVLGWLMPTLLGVLVVPITIALIFIAPVRSDRWAIRTALVVAGISLAVLIFGVSLGSNQAWIDVFHKPFHTPPLGGWQLLWLAPGLVMGFALCPYLDLTFHRARQATAPGTGMAAFSLGFGGVFALMILGTLAYAALLWPAINGQPAHLSSLWMSVLFIHLAIQIALTTALHAREVIRRARRVHGQALLPTVRLLLIGLAALVVGFLVPQGASTSPVPGPQHIPGLTRTTGETLYHLFLLAYAVVFPAYVWLCMIPTIRPTTASHRKLIYVLTVVIVLPMAYLTVVRGQTLWTFAGLGTLVFARLVLELTGALKPSQADRFTSAASEPPQS